MLITVKHSAKKKKDYDLEKDVVIIGRSSQCDITITSDNISRQHLEIKSEEGKVLIKDMSRKNWVSYDNEQLPKETYVQYFNFIDLMLPDDYFIVIKDPAASERRDSKIGLKAISKTNIVRPQQLKTRKILTVEQESNRLALSKYKGLIVTLVVSIVATALFFTFMR